MEKKVNCFYCGNEITEGGDPYMDLHGRRLCGSCYNRLSNIIEKMVHDYVDIIDKALYES